MGRAGLLIVLVLACTDAKFVSQDVPPVMFVGNPTPVRVTMKNSGGSTWGPGTQLYEIHGWTLWNNQLTPGEYVAPGVERTFNVTVLPKQGTSDEKVPVSFRIRDFGQTTPTTYVTVHPELEEHAECIEFTSWEVQGGVAVPKPFPTTMNRDLYLPFHISIKNTGQSTWYRDTHRLHVLPILPWSAQWFRVTGDAVPFANFFRIWQKDIVPGDAFTADLYLRTPHEPGKYLLAMMIANGDNYFFDACVGPEIEIKAPSYSIDSEFVSTNLTPNSFGDVFVDAWQALHVEMTFKNVGLNPWGVNYVLMPAAPDAVIAKFAPTYKTIKFSLPQGVTVSPGASGTFSFDLSPDMVQALSGVPLRWAVVNDALYHLADGNYIYSFYQPQMGLSPEIRLLPKGN